MFHPWLSTRIPRRWLFFFCCCIFFLLYVPSLSLYIRCPILFRTTCFECLIEHSKQGMRNFFFFFFLHHLKVCFSVPVCECHCHSEPYVHFTCENLWRSRHVRHVEVIGWIKNERSMLICYWRLHCGVKPLPRVGPRSAPSSVLLQLFPISQPFLPVCLTPRFNWSNVVLGWKLQSVFLPQVIFISLLSSPLFFLSIFLLLFLHHVCIHPSSRFICCLLCLLIKY